MAAPLVFISYSHDSEPHKEWVKKLASDLRALGIDAVLDQWDLRAGQDMAKFMQDGVSKSDRVIMICSSPYVKKAEAGIGGVGFERLIVTAEVVQSIDTIKFVPVLRSNGEGKTPIFLGPRMYIDLRKDAAYSAGLEELRRELLGIPNDKPPLGSRPFDGSPPKIETPARATGSTGRAQSGIPILDDQWFADQFAVGANGLGSMGLSGSLELRIALHDELNKSQTELLEAIRASEIRTFGWPIGITLENRDDARPRPYPDGVRAEVAINRDEKKSPEENSYDYWAAKSNGDFYLLQSLFEDRRRPNQIFFNTRIVRVTEGLLFTRNLYEHLGVPDDTRANFRCRHRGIQGRMLSSSNPNRELFLSPTTRAEECQSEITIELGKISEQLVDHVEQLLSPLFVLFDFQRFDRLVYTDIVRRFERGDVS